MSSHAIIFCEGAHDQAAIVSLALVCGGWKVQEAVPDSLPEEVRAAFPDPKRTSSGGWRFEGEPQCLVKEDCRLIVRALGGDSNVLGEAALAILGQIRVEAVGVVVDANQAGVEARVESFRGWYGRAYTHAANVEAGRVIGDNPRLGLWVAPDNLRNGRLDDLLIKAASRSQKKLVERGRRFATSLAKVKPDKWMDHRNKAILGAINQVVRPGASLAAALQKSRGWFEASLGQVRPFKQLLRFLEELAGVAA